MTIEEFRRIGVLDVPVSPSVKEGDLVAKQRAVAKAPIVFSQADDPTKHWWSTGIIFYIGGIHAEGTINGHVAVIEQDGIREIWLHDSLKRSPFIGFLGADLLPVGEKHYVNRFDIGRGHSVRICSDRSTGLCYLALPPEEEALNWINWFDLELPKEVR